MGEKRNATPEQIDDYRVTFVRTIETATRLLGNSAFRMLGADGQPTETAVNRALLETQLLASSWAANPRLADPASVRARVAALFSDHEFVDAVQRATGDRLRTLIRARHTVAAFAEAGAQMDVPYDLNA